MLSYQILYLASLITFTFGAVTFSVLAWSYARSRRLRPADGSLFPRLVVACAVAFGANLIARISGVSLPVGVFAAILPPLLAHLVIRDQRLTGWGWSWAVGAFYVASLGPAVITAASDAEWVRIEWSDSLESSPSWSLGLAAAVALVALFVSRLERTVGEDRHRRWNVLILALTAVCAVANLFSPRSFVGLLPDYLILTFLCVWLYYRERLAFFDLMIKRGAFFAIGLVGLTLFFVIAPRAFDWSAQHWSTPWVAALALVPFWLTGPWMYSRLTGMIDRVFLKRRYSAAEAERHFSRELQVAADEDDLRKRATTSLAEIFQAPVTVSFGSEARVDSELDCGLEPRGWIALAARRNAVPFLSDDHRLLQTLARTLSVVLENVRFRHSEQQLRLLASRAELKALRAQINPHFLFNSLNAIAGLIAVNPSLADDTVEQLAHVFRYTLRKSEKEWARLDEEIEFVRAYLRVEQARFGERLQTEFEIDAAAGPVPIPAMSIQPLIENALKHGVSTAGRARVGVKAHVVGEQLCIEVGDEGPGFPSNFDIASSPGHGLRNIAERLKGYYGNAARLSCEGNGDGARVVMTLPRDGRLM